MKLKCKVFTVLIALLIAFAAAPGAFAEEKTKEYNEAWLAGIVDKLEVENKFGDVTVRNSGGSEVTIDVVITVEAPNEAKADELLELINVEFEESGGVVSAVTIIDNQFKSNQDFSIDYEVNIPSDKELAITNKYGNTAVATLNASGEFDIQYGNFTASSLNAPASGSMSINLEYGKADVSVASDMDVVVKYSTINLGTVDDLEMESRYTVVNIDEGSSVAVDSRYDTFNFDEIGSVNATTKYSHIEIGELTTSLIVDAGYGGIRVDDVNPDFESVNITNSYGQISLGMDGGGYMLDAKCEYCGIDFPADDFIGDQRDDNQTRIVKGTVGDSANGTVLLNSRYGQIELED